MEQDACRCAMDRMEICFGESAESVPGLREVPEPWASLDDDMVDVRLRRVRAALGGSVVVLAHHYQVDGVIAHADHVGDSYALSCQARAEQSAKTIVFAGVHFMAESADVLTLGERRVILPDARAGCPMAEMASASLVEVALEELEDALGPVRPVAYMNTSAAVKDVVGRLGGSICTSSNAVAVVRAMLAEADRVLFVPDEHLGRNAGAAMGLEDDEVVVWSRHRPLGGRTPEELRRARLVLWDGYCSVHTAFRPEHVVQVRAAVPGVRVVVHPECPAPVVQLADASGSTAQIVRMVEAGDPGASFAIGTEIHLVERLRRRFPDREVRSLSPFQCVCATMYRVRPASLLWCLESLAAGQVVNRIRVSSDVASGARVALERMIAITEASGAVR